MGAMGKSGWDWGLHPNHCVFDSIFQDPILPGMSTHRPVFAQIVGRLDPTEFARCAALFPPARPPRGLSAYDHFLALCFGQLTHRDSLRDLAACLQTRRAYHAGFRTRVSRTNPCRRSKWPIPLWNSTAMR